MRDLKSYPTWILVASIGLIGILGIVLLTNWDKIFPTSSELALETDILNVEDKSEYDIIFNEDVAISFINPETEEEIEDYET